MPGFPRLGLQRIPSDSESVNLPCCGWKLDMLVMLGAGVVIIMIVPPPRADPGPGPWLRPRPGRDFWTPPVPPGTSSRPAPSPSRISDRVPSPGQARAALGHAGRTSPGGAAWAHSELP